MIAATNSATSVPTAPWKDTAVAVLRRQQPASTKAEPVILMEGSLANVLEWYRSLPDEKRGGISIHLPDRGRAPFSYEGKGLQALCQSADRPLV